MCFETLTEHEVEIFALHINFLNLNEFFFSVFMQHTDKMYQESGFWGAFFGTVYCRIAGASGNFIPWTPPQLCLGPMCTFQILRGCQGRRTGVGVTTVSNSLILGGRVTKVLKNGDEK